MTKRIFAWLLSLAMLLSFVPSVTMGVAAVDPDLPGASEYCNHTSHTGWTEWTEAGSLPTTAGNYYLGVDVELTAAWDAYGDIHLCLNGHSITQTAAASRVINVRS